MATWQLKFLQFVYKYTKSRLIETFNLRARREIASLHLFRCYRYGDNRHSVLAPYGFAIAHYQTIRPGLNFQHTTLFTHYKLFAVFFPPYHDFCISSTGAVCEKQTRVFSCHFVLEPHKCCRLPRGFLWQTHIADQFLCRSEIIFTCQSFCNVQSASMSYRM